MSSGTDENRSDKQARLAEVMAIVRDLIRKRRSGLELDYSDVESQHPHLMPELRDHIRALRNIESAQEWVAKSLADRELCDVPCDEVKFLQDNLPGYRILDRIEYGGQGIVYRALQSSTMRIVAIKILLDGPLATGRQRQRFAREVRLVSRLGHPNVVTMYDSGTVGNRLFAIMEYVDGIPIDEYAELHDLNPREIVELFRDVCRAVGATHQHGIIHRDLKPSNILVDLDACPHLLDFGLAMDTLDKDPVEQTVSVSEAGHVVGTLPYLSPEQALGTGVVDIRSDLYSIGVTLYKTLTHKFPYDVTGTPELVRSRIISAQATVPSHAYKKECGERGSTKHRINSDLDAIILKSLAKRKEDRYQSATSLADDLDRYLRGEAVAAKADRHAYVLLKAIKNCRVPAAMFLAALILLVGSLIGMAILWQRAERLAIPRECMRNVETHEIGLQEDDLDGPSRNSVPGQLSHEQAGRQLH